MVHCLAAAAAVEVAAAVVAVVDVAVVEPLVLQENSEIKQLDVVDPKLRIEHVVQEAWRS